MQGIMPKVVIKAGETSPIPQGGLRLELRDVSQKVEHTIHEAKREAEVILQSARNKAHAACPFVYYRSCHGFGQVTCS